MYTNEEGSLREEVGVSRLESSSTDTEFGLGKPRLAQQVWF